MDNQLHNEKNNTEVRIDGDQVSLGGEVILRDRRLKMPKSKYRCYTSNARIKPKADFKAPSFNDLFPIA
jgi:hypothetical protein